MNTPLVEAAAALRRAHEAGTPCPPIRSASLRNNPETGYAVQELNTQYWLNAGRVLVGRKIGLTSEAVQSQMGVNQPDFGMLFADMEIAEGESIAAGRLMQPRVEGEVAFTVARDLMDRIHRADVAAALAHAQVAAEIVDSRIENWDIQIVDTVADNASSGVYVLGPQKVPLEGLDLANGTMVLERRGEICSSGTGTACLGHPLNAVTWLVNTMVEVGRPLRAGDLILSGAWGPLVPARPGDHLTLRITGLGEAHVVFAPLGHAENG